MVFRRPLAVAVGTAVGLLVYFLAWLGLSSGLDLFVDPAARVPSWGAYLKGAVWLLSPAIGAGAGFFVGQALWNARPAEPGMKTA